MPEPPPEAPDSPQVIAAVDLGSNSFHMLVARYTDGHLIILDRLREMVRFAAGLDDRGRVSGEAAQKALDCLGRFGQRLSDMHAGSVRAVGTNTFRRAKNAAEFLTAAEEALGHPIEIISGREEARLVYLGACHSTPSLDGRRLVVDIGGGSTELIIGSGFETRLLQSLYIGCVGISKEYFPGGKVSTKRMQRARLAARMELEPVRASMRHLGWEHVIGTSGTIRATELILRESGESQEGITLPAMESLAARLVAAGHVDHVQAPGLSSERAPVYLGGLAILMSVFESLDLTHMRVSDGALREGLLYDLLGRLTDEDVRVRTVNALQRRYHIDRKQARRVENVVMKLLSATRDAWGLDDPLLARLLRWAARLHEVGLAIAHAGYHKHGGYLLENAELAGFSKREQKLLAKLVRAHRRKIGHDVFEDLESNWREPILLSAALLRIAVLLNRGRSDGRLPEFGVKARPGKLTLRLPPEWLAEHPLTCADLKREAGYLSAVNLDLVFV